MTTAHQAIRNEIAKKETQLAALREALALLVPNARGRAGKRRPKTAAEKKALSKAMRAAWRRRKADASPGQTVRKASAKKPSKKSS